MSTISLMPISKKVKFTKDCKFEVEKYSSFLSGADKILRESGIYVGDQLIFDAGSKIRIEGFSSSVGDKGWPRTKITIFPEGHKSCQCYVSLEQLDGVSWETIEGDAPKEKKEVQRINISMSKYFEENKKGGIWSNCFDGRYIRGDNEKKMVNPLKLSKEDISSGAFIDWGKEEIGEVIVKKGKSSWSYKITLKTEYVFSLITEPGLMYAKIKSVKDFVWIQETYSQREGFEIGSVGDWADFKIEERITKFLKEKHKFDERA